MIDKSGLFPTFIVVKRNPFEVKETARMEFLLELQPDGDGADVNTEDIDYFSTQALVEVRVFRNFRFCDRFISYVYDDGFIHVIQMLGRYADLTDGSIEILGGQGHTTQKAWGQWRTGPPMISLSSPSTWALDLDGVQPRLHGVEFQRMKIELG